MDSTEEERRAKRGNLHAVSLGSRVRESREGGGEYRVRSGGKEPAGKSCGLRGGKIGVRPKKQGGVSKKRAKGGKMTTYRQEENCVAVSEGDGQGLGGGSKPRGEKGWGRGRRSEGHGLTKN